VKHDKIKFGTVVTLGGDQDSNDIVITIMGPWETDPENHVYSYQAPAVNRLLGKEKGDVVEFLDMEMTVREITVYGLNV
jgi:transcription elongation GreA/GreB family factor